MRLMKNLCRVVVAGAVLATALVAPAAAGADVKPVLTAAHPASGGLHVTIGTTPEVNENTYGYLMVGLKKWSNKRSKWVPVKGESHPDGWTHGTWTEGGNFEAFFDKAPARGKCKLIAKYWDHTQDSTATKDAQRFPCASGFSA